MSAENSKTATTHAAGSWRIWLVVVLLIAVSGAITYKLLSLYTVDQAFLQTQGEARSVRQTLIPAHRGLITDRNGEPLAVSAPVATIWADPKMTDLTHPGWQRLAQLLEVSREDLLTRINNQAGRRFMYLRRQVTPEVAESVQALAIPGINVDREYRRYYPAGEVASHLVGFTNLDGEGQEGLELAYNHALRGEPGRKLVMRDRVGRTISHLRSLEDPRPGTDLELTIDLRLQYLAYRELKGVVEAHQADAGSIVILDVDTGGILAMANMPSYNPNDRSRMDPAAMRNRAVTDLFEPGSTMKPMTVAAALMTGRYRPDTVINTSPGLMRVRNATVRDIRNFGAIDLTEMITRSSNVGPVKLALDMEANRLPMLLQNAGIGQMTLINFPGERTGVLPFPNERQTVERATMAYGYGLSVTALQLAQSYQIFAADGLMRPVSLLRGQQQDAMRVMPPGVGQQVLEMMETVTRAPGTATRAAVEGYRTAAKTGTVHRIGPGGYNREEYVAIIAGVAPVSDPRLVVVVMVDNPRGREYYAGLVAAPVFSRVVSGALRLMNVAPDALPERRTQVVQR